MRQRPSSPAEGSIPKEQKMTSVTRRDLVKTVAAAPALMAGLNFVAGGAAADETKTGAGAASVPTERFDFVVAGAGHNSLTCGAYLAKAGYRVLVLEGHQVIGGGCKTQEILLPGFKEDLCSSCHTVILRNPLAINNELDLDQYGYELLHPEVVLHYHFKTAPHSPSFTITLSAPLPPSLRCRNEMRKPSDAPPRRAPRSRHRKYPPGRSRRAYRRTPPTN